jgi:hypothetical protein
MVVEESTTPIRVIQTLPEPLSSPHRAGVPVQLKVDGPE